MSNIINDPVLVSAIQDLARGIKSEDDLFSLTRKLLKITVETLMPKWRDCFYNSSNRWTTHEWSIKNNPLI